MSGCFVDVNSGNHLYVGITVSLTKGKDNGHLRWRISHWNNGRQLFKCMYLSAAHKEIDCLVVLPLPALC